MKPPKQLRILCLGASLVAGFSSGGAVYHPFSHNLVQKLRIAMPDTEIEVVVDGVPGDRVTTGRFIDRMKNQCKLQQHTVRSPDRCRTLILTSCL